jgi:hypothetical protein
MVHLFFAYKFYNIVFNIKLLDLIKTDEESTITYLLINTILSHFNCIVVESDDSSLGARNEMKMSPCFLPIHIAILLFTTKTISCQIYKDLSKKVFNWLLIHHNSYDQNILIKALIRIIWLAFNLLMNFTILLLTSSF